MVKYRLGKDSKRHLKRRIWRGVWVLGFLILLAVIGVILWLIMNNSDGPATQPVAITHEYKADNPTGKLFDEALFSIRLPEDWRLESREEQNYNYYRFQATQQRADNRWLEIYIGRVPTDLGFNRLISVHTMSTGMSLASTVSDNCIKFTAGASIPANGIVPAKWSNVTFPCDAARSSQNKVGVGSSDQGIHLSFDGEASRGQTFTIIYTDHNSSPNYQILEESLESFVAK